MAMSLTMRHSSHHPASTTAIRSSSRDKPKPKRTSLLVDFSQPSCKDATSILDRDGVLRQTDVCTSLHSVVHSIHSNHNNSRHSAGHRRRRRVSLSAAVPLFSQAPPTTTENNRRASLPRSLSGHRIFDRDCLMRVLDQVAAPVKMPRTEKRRSWSGACTSTTTTTTTEDVPLLTFSLKRRSCQPLQDCSSMVSPPPQAADTLGKKAPTRSYVLDASDTTTTTTMSTSHNSFSEGMDHSGDESVGTTKSTVGSRRDELRRTLSASSRGGGRSQSMRNVMLMSSSNASVNTAPLRALRKASSKTKLIEQAGHELHVFGTTDATNAHAKTLRRSNRQSPSSGRRGLLSKSRSAYGRLTVGGDTGSTNSSSGSGSDASLDASQPQNRRSLLSQSRKNKSQPQLLLPRQRSLRELQESKEKAMVRPALAKQGSFTTQQSEIAALEALAGKKVPTRRTDLTRSHSCSAVKEDDDTRTRTTKRSSSSKDLTLSPTSVTSTPTRVVPSTRRVPRGTLMRDESSVSVTSAKSRRRRQRAKVLESKMTSTRKSHSMRHLPSTTTRRNNSRQEKNCSSRGSSKSSSSSEEEQCRPSPRMSLPNLPSTSHRAMKE